MRNARKKTIAAIPEGCGAIPGRPTLSEGPTVQARDFASTSVPMAA